MTLPTHILTKLLKTSADSVIRPEKLDGGGSGPQVIPDGKVTGLQRNEITLPDGSKVKGLAAPNMNVQGKGTDKLVAKAKELKGYVGDNAKELGNSINESVKAYKESPDTITNALTAAGSRIADGLSDTYTKGKAQEAAKKTVPQNDGTKASPEKVKADNAKFDAELKAHDQAEGAARGAASTGVLAPKPLANYDSPAAENFLNQVSVPADAPNSPIDPNQSMVTKAHNFMKRPLSGVGGTLGDLTSPYAMAGAAGLGLGAYALYKLLNKKQKKTAAVLGPVMNAVKAVKNKVVNAGKAVAAPIKNNPIKSTAVAAGTAGVGAGLAARPAVDGALKASEPTAGDKVKKVIDNPGQAASDAWEWAKKPLYGDHVMASPVGIAGGAAALGLGAYALRKLLSKDDESDE